MKKNNSLLFDLSPEDCRQFLFGDDLERWDELIAVVRKRFERRVRRIRREQAVPRALREPRGSASRKWRVLLSGSREALAYLADLREWKTKFLWNCVLDRINGYAEF